MYAKKMDIDLNRGFVQQLFALEQRLYTMHDELDSFRGDIKKRRREWDPSYLDLCRGPLKEEELVMINSYRNGRPTIDALPSPSPGAFDAPREFTLKFNPLRQEEGVHMFPQEPPSSGIVPPLGITECEVA